MYSRTNRFHRRGSTFKDREDFGDLLRGYILQLSENQKVAVADVCELAKMYYDKTRINYKAETKKKDTKKVCTLSEASLIRVIKGGEWKYRYRSFGEDDAPVDLLWLTVAFVYFGILSLGWPLENWLHQEIPTNLASDKGIAWMEERIPIILKTLDFTIAAQDITTQKDIPAITITTGKEADTGPHAEIKQSSAVGINQQNTDKLQSVDKFRANLDYIDLTM